MRQSRAKKLHLVPPLGITSGNSGQQKSGQVNLSTTFSLRQFLEKCRRKSDIVLCCYLVRAISNALTTISVFLVEHPNSICPNQELPSCVLVRYRSDNTNQENQLLGPSNLTISFPFFPTTQYLLYTKLKILCFSRTQLCSIRFTLWKSGNWFYLFTKFHSPSANVPSSDFDL